MAEIKKNIALIPARGGSKSIPLKNIKLLAGKPLIYWVLDAATRSRSIEHTYVATDYPIIKDCIQDYNSSKVTVIDRKPENATDDASTESVMLEFTERFQYEYLFLIQATSPLLKSVHLDEGFEKLIKYELDSILSVVRQKRFIWQENRKRIVKPVNYDPKSRPLRQNFDGILVENGAFYICKRDNLINSQSRIHGNIGSYEMPEDTLLELDEGFDEKHINLILTEKTAKLRINNLKEIKAVVTDVDGCLTNSGMYYSNEGDELKKFNTRDGKGFEILQNLGIVTGIITSENTQIVKKRSQKLNIDYLAQGIKNKEIEIVNFAKQFNLTLDEILYIGDDLNDKEVMSIVGISVCPNNAVTEIKNCADFKTVNNGGDGVLREIADILYTTLR